MVEMDQGRGSFVKQVARRGGGGEGVNRRLPSALSASTAPQALVSGRPRPRFSTRSLWARGPQGAV